MDRFESTLEYLITQLPMFQRTGPAAYKHSLENTLILDEIYGHPHLKFRSLHIAGTNGKGSVSHMLASVLQSAGFRTGLYTSPHLKDFRERIRINGQMIPKQEVVRWVDDFRERNRVHLLEPSFFELTAAMAFDYFANEKVDIAVIEVGLGGRLDSTNIITPLVSIITNISYDHENLLGNTLPKIAGEKAGIIKSGVPVVISQFQPEVANVFIEKAEKENSPLHFAGNEFFAEMGTISPDGCKEYDFSQLELLRFPGLKTDLPGNYQRLNIPAILKTIDILNDLDIDISDLAVYEGLASVTSKTGLQGRWQTIGHEPLIICDTGHNEDGIRLVTEQLSRLRYHQLHFILGVVADKEPAKVLALLPANAHYYFTRAQIPRAMNENDLKQKAAIYGLDGEAYPTVIEAFNAAKNNAGKHDLIFVGGSTFVVGEIL